MWLPMSTWASKGDEIVVTLPGTSYVVTYYRAAAFLSNVSPNATLFLRRATNDIGRSSARAEIPLPVY